MKAQCRKGLKKKYLRIILKFKRLPSVSNNETMEMAHKLSKKNIVRASTKTEVEGSFLTWTVHVVS